MKSAALALCIMAGVARLRAGLPEELFSPVMSAVPRMTVVSQEQVEGVQLTSLRFEGLEGSPDGSTRACQVFAYEARPLGDEGEKPGILLCHGGTNSALREKAIGWAKLGYVAISPEFAAYVAREKAQSLARFLTVPYMQQVCVVQPSPRASLLYDSINTGLLAFNLLASDPQVNPRRVVIAGVSWGGFMSLKLATLLGDRVAGVFTLYGTGFFAENIPGIGSHLNELDEAGRQEWIGAFDVAGALQNIRAPVFFCAAANDAYFHPPSVMDSYRSIETPKRLCFGPNKSHWIALPGGTISWTGPTWTDMEPVFFESLWHPADIVLPDVRLASETDGGQMLFSVSPNAKNPAAWIYATRDVELPWEKRIWTRFAVAASTPGTYSGLVPSDWKTFDWYGGISFPITVQGVKRHVSLTTPIDSVRTSPSP